MLQGLPESFGELEASTSSLKQPIGEIYEIYFLAPPREENQLDKSFKFTEDGFVLKSARKSARKLKLSAWGHKTFDLIGRALLDREFQSFLKRLGPTVDAYCEKL